MQVFQIKLKYHYSIANHYCRNFSCSSTITFIIQGKKFRRFDWLIMVVFLRNRGITHKKRCYNEVTMTTAQSRIFVFLFAKKWGPGSQKFPGTKCNSSPKNPSTEIQSKLRRLGSRFGRCGRQPWDLNDDIIDFKIQCQRTERASLAILCRNSQK